ncbi:hypothetical protein JW805_01065 [Roseomonas aeriglobus]|nr:hypothetical protein [Roseomonas aeriglobus]
MIGSVMAMLLLMPAQQTAAAPPSGDSWSILVDPCSSTSTEVVVCAPGAQYRLPNPEDRERTPRPRQATGDPRAGLENAAEPCAIRGCQVGIDLLTPAIAVASAVVREATFAARKTHPGKREAIKLD